MAKRLVAWALALGVIGVGLLPTRVSDAEDFKKAPDSCKRAHAVLGWSKFKEQEQHDDLWKTLGFVMHSKAFWHIIDEPEDGVAQKAAFRQYKVKGIEDGHGYVAHCGHGGTCNAIAASFFKAYKHAGKPMVYCGPIPNVLKDPSKPEIYKPTEEEIQEWNESDEDFDDGMGDDDDDDFGDDDDDGFGDDDDDKSKDDQADDDADGFDD